MKCKYCKLFLNGDDFYKRNKSRCKTCYSIAFKQIDKCSCGKEKYKKSKTCVTCSTENKKGKILYNDFYLNKEKYTELNILKRGKEKTATVLIDNEDVDKVSKYKWCLNNCGYATTRKSGKLSFLHHIVFPRDKEKVTDHINGNKLDNRKNNLRYATVTENNRNNIRKEAGVCWITQKLKYQAYIYPTKGKIKHLGFFTNKQEALDTRRKAEIEYYGMFSPQLKKYDWSTNYN